MSKNFKLDFIGLGVEKASTTWLANMLRQHPDIFIPIKKEIHYFNRKFIEDPKLDNYNFDKPFSWYKSFFKNTKSYKIKGEICPAYLWDKEAPIKIKKFFPDVKLFVILRNPSERTFSQYLYYYQKGTIKTKNIRKAIKKYPYLIYRSMYYIQLKKYFNLFPDKYIKIILFKDIKNNNKKALKDIQKYLCVKTYIPKNIDEKSNVTGLSKNRSLNIILSKIRNITRKYKLNFLLDFSRKIGLANKLEKLRNNSKKAFKSKPRLRKEDKEYLNKIFSEDIKKLERLIKKDLSEWKK